MRRSSKCQFSIAFAVLTVSTSVSAQPRPLELKGPFEIGLEKIIARDEARGKTRNSYLWYPVDPQDAAGQPLKYNFGNQSFESPFLGGFADAPASPGGPFPIIVLSHGDGASWPEQFAMLGEALASHGFVVAAPRHTADDRPESNENRPADVSFILDVLEQRNVTDGDIINGAIDFDALGLGGYSRGGPTILGNITGEGQAGVQVEPDPRVKAALFIDSTVSTPKMEIPVLEVGTSLRQHSIWVPRLYSLAIDNTHHWSFGLNGCQFRDELIESGLRESAADSLIDTVRWLGCLENFRPIDDVQELMSLHAIAFFMQHLDGNDEYESVLQPKVNALDGSLAIWPNVHGERVREGLEFLVTDPEGRKLGFDATSGELVNDFGDKARHTIPGRNAQRFEIAQDDLIPGEYMLTGTVADSLTETQEFEVAIGYQNLRGDDVVGFKERITSFPISAGMNLEPVVFVVPSSLPELTLHAGDADEDLDFDQIDLVQVQIAAKYLTGQSATWGEGDWDSAPGGSPGRPPVGDGTFNQIDIVAAQQNGVYLTGPYGVVASHPGGDGNATLIYDPATGELTVEVGERELTSINIDSAASIFTGDAAGNLGGSFDNDADNNIFKATFGSSFGSLSFGNVAQPGLTTDFLTADLSVIGSLTGGGELGAVDLIIVPEPSALILGMLGFASIVLAQRRRILSRSKPSLNGDGRPFLRVSS